MERESPYTLNTSKNGREQIAKIVLHFVNQRIIMSDLTKRKSQVEDSISSNRSLTLTKDKYDLVSINNRTRRESRRMKVVQAEMQTNFIDGMIDAFRNGQMNPWIFLCVRTLRTRAKHDQSSVIQMMITIVAPEFPFGYPNSIPNNVSFSPHHPDKRRFSYFHRFDPNEQIGPTSPFLHGRSKSSHRSMRDSLHRSLTRNTLSIDNYRSAEN